MSRRLFYLNAVLVLISTALLLRLFSLDSRRLRHVPASHGHVEAPGPDEVGSVNASSYIGVARRLLFSRDRNADVMAPPVKDILPPPPPPPPFPRSYGVMTGDDPRVILSAAGSTDGQRIYKFGDRVGGWQIVKFDSKSITLKFMDTEVTKGLSELVDTAPVVAQVQVPARQPEPAPAPGAIVDGMKKVCGAFGPSCYWEPVKKQ